MFKSVLFLAFIHCALQVYSQLPCSKPEYRHLDFWIGEWEVFGKNGKKAGESSVSLMLDSCTLFEQWTSETIQKGLRYAGKSMNVFNSITGEWQQFWTDNAGGISAYLHGQWDDGKMIFVTDNLKINDSTWQIQKMTFYNLGTQQLRQHGETSNDGGKTWTTSFDLEYRRKN